MLHHKTNKSSRKNLYNNDVTYDDTVFSCVKNDKFRPTTIINTKILFRTPFFYKLYALDAGDINLLFKCSLFMLDIGKLYFWKTLSNGYELKNKEKIV